MLSILMPNLKIAKVAVPGPFLFPLDYLLEPAQDLLSEGEFTQVAVVGGRVWVPFRNKKIVGLVMAITESADFDLAKIKPISEAIDSVALFSAKDLSLFQWASQYYHEPIGEVISAALPKRLRQGEPSHIQGVAHWQLTEMGKTIQQSDLAGNAKRQKSVLASFQNAQQPLLSSTHLSQDSDNWRPALNKFIESGWVEESKGPCLLESDYPPSPNHRLNEEQQDAVNNVTKWLETENPFASFLVQGVTGSGKTEVYLGMIEAVLKLGKQALVLVPEIGLTPQMVARFEAQLQTRVATLHSGLNDAERHCAWHLVRTGQVKVLLGTRSALFTPFKELGICIIDEEHDLSYKQQEGFRYSARDLLVRRAFQEKVPVVMGSATPSLESLHNVKSKRYYHLKLKQRAGNATLPSLKLLDIRGEKIQEGVSRKLQTAMDSHLKQGGQVLLFLNRRGFAPVLMCHECGWQASCPSCDANMTLHTGKIHDYLQCHHCGEQELAPISCPSCDGEEFVKLGQGTERLEEAITDWFPENSILRIDRDTTRLKGKMAELTGIAQRGEADILIGTQMLAKGHHFPNVTLVGILDVDQGLFSADYRAPERMAQLILQVAGRAGRAEKQGEVLIQTHHPDHPLLITLIREGYDAFAQQALEERVHAKLPPTRYQILIRAEASNPNDVMAFLQSLKAGLELNQQQFIQESGNVSEVEFWGPVAAPMLRRQGRYRFQLLLQSAERGQVHRVLRELEPHIYQSPLARKVRWSIDVDPQEMM
ncbi:primosomal protein N' [Thiomicrorhabdus arctica]|uniref:primosomal protein N' n=1 Tax=Thiomicrorhabdus arctica TaxID=131540 RepID=UPI001FDF0AF6|nr:primosomal protein N' [Thiomicrorhabdus arctica]